MPHAQTHTGFTMIEEAARRISLAMTGELQRHPLGLDVRRQVETSKIAHRIMANPMGRETFESASERCERAYQRLVEHGYGPVS